MDSFTFSGPGCSGESGFVAKFCTADEMQNVSTRKDLEPLHELRRLLHVVLGFLEEDEIYLSACDCKRVDFLSLISIKPN